MQPPNLCLLPYLDIFKSLDLNIRDIKNIIARNGIQESVNKTEICLVISATNNDILFKTYIWIIRTRITGSGLNSTLNTVCFLMFLNMLRSFLNNPDKKINFFNYFHHST